MLLIVRRCLNGNAITGRDANARGTDRGWCDTALTADTGIGLQVNFENSVVAWIHLVRSGGKQSLRLFANGPGEAPRLGLGLFTGSCGPAQGVLGGADHELEQEIRHHQLLSDVVEAVQSFILRKFPFHTGGHIGDRPAALGIDDLRPDGRAAVIGTFEIKQIAQGVTQLGTVEPAENRGSTSALLLGVGCIEPGREHIGESCSFGA